MERTISWSMPAHNGPGILRLRLRVGGSDKTENRFCSGTQFGKMLKGFQKLSLYKYKKTRWICLNNVSNQFRKWVYLNAYFLTSGWNEAYYIPTEHKASCTCNHLFLPRTLIFYWKLGLIVAEACKRRRVLRWFWG